MNVTDATRVFASRTFSARALSPGGMSWPVRLLLALLFFVIVVLAIAVIVPLTVLVIAWLLLRGLARAAGRMIFGTGPARAVNPVSQTAPIDAEFDVIDARADRGDSDSGRQNVRVRQSL